MRNSIRSIKVVCGSKPNRFNVTYVTRRDWVFSVDMPHKRTNVSATSVDRLLMISDLYNVVVSKVASVKLFALRLNR